MSKQVKVQVQKPVKAVNVKVTSQKQGAKVKVNTVNTKTVVVDLYDGGEF